MKILKIFITIFIYTFLSSCGTSNKSYYGKNYNSWKDDQLKRFNKIVHSIYIVGGAGTLDFNKKIPW